MGLSPGLLLLSVSSLFASIYPDFRNCSISLELILETYTLEEETNTGNGLGYHLSNDLHSLLKYH